jgi:hypothetical protein
MHGQGQRLLVRGVVLSTWDRYVKRFEERLMRDDDRSSELTLPFLFSGHHSSPRKSVETGPANHYLTVRNQSFPLHSVTSFLLSWPDKFELHSLQQGPMIGVLRTPKIFANVAALEVSR